MPATQTIERMAKAMWEESHTQERPWRNKIDSDGGQIDKYIDTARVAAEVMESANASR